MLGVRELGNSWEALGTLPGRGFVMSANWSCSVKEPVSEKDSLRLRTRVQSDPSNQDSQDIQGASWKTQNF
jgi:hypothetical protein